MNGDLTLINVSDIGQWASCRATEGPWPIRRVDKALSKDVVEGMIRDITTGRTNVMGADGVG